MQVIFVILLHIDYTLNAKYEIFLKYLLFKRKISYFYYKKLSYHLHLIKYKNTFTYQIYMNKVLTNTSIEIKI